MKDSPIPHRGPGQCNEEHKRIKQTGGKRKYSMLVCDIPMDTNPLKYFLKTLLIRKFKQTDACKISIYKLIIVLHTNTKQWKVSVFRVHKKQQKDHQKLKVELKQIVWELSNESRHQQRKYHNMGTSGEQHPVRNWQSAAAKSVLHRDFIV